MYEAYMPYVTEVLRGILAKDSPSGFTRQAADYAMEQFRALDPSPEEVFRCCSRETKGVYVFKALERDYLDALIGGRLRFGYKLMWEISVKEKREVY